MSKQHELVGKVFPTNYGGDCVVVEYVNCSDVTVEFLDKYKGRVKLEQKALEKVLWETPTRAT